MEHGSSAVPVLVIARNHDAFCVPLHVSFFVSVYVQGSQSNLLFFWTRPHYTAHTQTYGCVPTPDYGRCLIYVFALKSILTRVPFVLLLLEFLLFGELDAS